MNKILFFIFILILHSCESRTYEEISAKTNEKITYEKHIKPIMDTKCTTCHSATGFASYYPLSEYNHVKTNIIGILDRIQRPENDPLKMPKGTTISTTEINTIKTWQSEGMPEK